ncbi:MAG: carboxypeptidase regulatory-like domain-containing protein [Candidatus Acidiferrales bacterium]
MNKSRWFLLGVLVLAMVVALAPCSSAQESAAKGSLTGTVVDSTGGAIVSAQTTLEGPQGSKSIATNGSGLFTFQDLIPGIYKLDVEMKGFRKAEVPDITINVGRVTAVRVQLEPGSVTSTVEVVSSAVTIDTSSTAVATNLNDDFYSKLPVQRGVAGLFYLAPGVVSGGGTGASNPSIGGATGLENLYIADGVSITDTAFGGIGVFSRVYGSVGTGINLSFVKEVQIKTGSIQPQYGGATGGVVQIVTKSGGNQYHGAIAGYFQPKQFEAQRSNVDAFNLANPVGDLIHRANFDVSGEFGGPVPFVGKDKLFFFGSFDPSRVDSETLGPPLSGQFEFGDLTGRQLSYNYAAKLTFKLSDKHSLEGSVFGDPTYSNIFPWQRLTEGPGGFPNTTNFSKLQFANRDVVARYNGTLSPTWVLNIDATWQHNAFTESQIDQGQSRIIDQTQACAGPPGGGTLCGLQFGIAPPGPNVQQGAFTPVGKGFVENTRDESYGAHINTSKIVNFWGQHAFDIGYGYNRPFYNGIRSNSGPVIVPPEFNQDGTRNSSQCSGAPGGCPWSGLNANYEWSLLISKTCPVGGATPNCALLNVPGISGLGPAGPDHDLTPVVLKMFRSEFGVAADGFKHFSTTGRTHSAYINDSWTINKYITVNAGLRWQQERLIGADTQYTFTDNWSPAFGVNVDPWGDRKNKFWFSFGRYNYNLPLDLAERSLTNELDLFSMRLVPDYTVDASGNRVATINGFGTVTPIVDAAHVLNRAAGSPFGSVFGSLESLEAIHSGTKLTYEDEYVMGFEHQFSHGLVLSARYMHRSLRRIVEDTGGIAPEAANAGVPQQFSITNVAKNTDIFTNPIEFPYKSAVGPPVACGADDFDSGVITDSSGNVLHDTNGNDSACFAEDGSGTAIGVNGLPAGGVVPDGIPDGFTDPIHKYWAVVFEVNKSFSHNWQLRANYTISKVFGNFEGAFRNDNGQSDPGISSLFDFTSGLFGQLGGQFTPGVLNQDRTQVANGYFSYVFDHGMLKNLTLGTGVTVSTGTPITELGSHPVYLNSGEIPIGGRGALGRTPTTGFVNFHADYLWSMTERFKLRLGTDLFNIANTKRILFINQTDSLQFGVPNADFLKPGVQTTALAADGIQSPFNARIFARIEF